ncbi:MAG: prolipoprotein diacylglyceryl transferase [Deltaproteobacteria bacterium]|nr:prolipoprotein diacylglyceryl transferase [Deltaproteobacteria bacterium]
MIPFYDWSRFTIAGVRVYTFGLLAALAALTAHHFSVRRARALGLDPNHADVFAIACLVGGFTFGHVLDVVLYRPRLVLERPLELLLLHRGLSSFGGFAGAVLAGLAYLRWKKLDPRVWADVTSYAFPFGWAVGRLGCALAHDHPGRRSESLLAVRFPPDWPPPPEAPMGGPRLDLGLLELLLTPVLALVVLRVARAKAPPGVLTGSLAVAYALLRFPLDHLRATDLPESDPRYLHLTPGQWASLGLLALGAWLVASGARRGAEG